MINLNTITSKASIAIIDLDRSFIGTPDYMGLAYFWAYEYRHYLRDCSNYRRKLAHNRLLKAGLSLDGVSEMHEILIKILTKKRR